MSNAQTTVRFFAATDANIITLVLSNIAKNYGITPAEALVAVTQDEAEHLLDYMTGPTRFVVSVLMEKHGLAA